MSSSYSIFKIITEGKASGRFLAGAMLSFSFSIAVILSTIGLMDGFENTLKLALENASGDFIVTSDKGFFLRQKVDAVLGENFSSTAMIEAQAFAGSKGRHKGVLVKGVEPESFKKVTDLDLGRLQNSIVIGKELASALDLNVGDDLVLTFASDNLRDQGGAVLKKYPISKIIMHGIYEKDLRFVYLPIAELAQAFSYRDGAVNKVLLDANSNLGFEASQAAIGAKLPRSFQVEPYWAEYRTLLRAVEVEKTSISLVLQVIVIVAIFNVIAFIIFISEKKAQEFFLLRAFGLSLKQMASFWRKLLVSMWFFSSLLAIALTWLFNIILGKLPIFDLPGDIYVLSSLSLDLGVEDYLLVFSLALVWVLAIGAVTMWRMKKRAVLSGLRQEFK